MMDDDTVEYWKEKYEDLNAQYDEFQQQSLELENELELQLKHSEIQIKEMQNRNNRLSLENETLKTKFNDVNISTHKQISSLQEELAKFKAVKEEMQKYIRELEQKNDNLEQTNRCAMFSLGEFEAKMNEALEQNAILQGEMEAKDDLSETVQRLRDETRDLKQELAVRQKANQSMNLKHTIETNAVLNSINKMDTTPVSVDTEAPSQQNSNMQAAQHQQALNTILNELNLKKQIPNGGGGMTPSVRISALNFVGDALRRVTSAESRLVATRNLMKESNRDRRSATISTMIDSAREMESNQISSNTEPTHSKILKTEQP